MFCDKLIVYQGNPHVSGRPAISGAISLPQAAFTTLETSLSTLETAWTSSPARTDCRSVAECRERAQLATTLLDQLDSLPLTPLATHAHALLPSLAPASRHQVTLGTEATERRWADLRAAVSDRQGVLEGVADHWQAWVRQEQEVGDTLAQLAAACRLPEGNLTVTSQCELEQALAAVNEAQRGLARARHEVHTAQSSANQVLAQLPPGLVKVELQKQVTGLQRRVDE